MSYEIRTAEITDFYSLVRLYQELNPDDPILSRTKGLPQLEKIIASPDLHIFVLVQHEALIATSYLNIMPNLTRGGAPYALIENVVTLSSEQNKGWGKKLMAHVSDYALGKGCYKIMLLTGRKDESTHGFYQSCGFNGSAKQGYVKYHRLNG